MTDRAVPTFRELFGLEPEVRAEAPGRVNLIGEHTDYSGGFVLPAAIPQRTVVELASSSNGAVTAWSANIAQDGERNAYALGAETLSGTWLDYIQGVTQVLGASGHRLGGFSVAIRSTVPVGSGLSSSAALEISLLKALRQAFSLPLTDVQLAQLGQRAENEFVGAPVGIMDQMACALADESHALFLDTRSLEYDRIPLPESAELMVINSGVEHSHAAGDYRRRRAECERAAELLGVPQLRDVTEDDLARIAALPEPLDRRARHVITENARVLAAVRALRAGDLREVGTLFSQSHASMRDDFEVSVPEIDLLVDIVERHAEVFGARLTGGGFGGSIVALVAHGGAARVAELVVPEYSRRSGRTGTVLLPDTPAARS